MHQIPGEEQLSVWTPCVWGIFPPSVSFLVGFSEAMTLAMLNPDLSNFFKSKYSVPKHLNTFQCDPDDLQGLRWSCWTSWVPRPCLSFPSSSTSGCSGATLVPLSPAMWPLQLQWLWVLKGRKSPIPVWDIFPVRNSVELFGFTTSPKPSLPGGTFPSWLCHLPWDGIILGQCKVSLLWQGWHWMSFLRSFSTQSIPWFSDSMISVELCRLCHHHHTDL